MKPHKALLELTELVADPYAHSRMIKLAEWRSKWLEAQAVETVVSYWMPLSPEARAATTEASLRALGERVAERGVTLEVYRAPTYLAEHERASITFFKSEHHMQNESQRRPSRLDEEGRVDRPQKPDAPHDDGLESIAAKDDPSPK